MASMIYNTSDGSLLADQMVEGAQVLPDHLIASYGGRFFICETITETMARHLAASFGFQLIVKGDSNND